MNKPRKKLGRSKTSHSVQRKDGIRRKTTTSALGENAVTSFSLPFNALKETPQSTTGAATATETTVKQPSASHAHVEDDLGSSSGDENLQKPRDPGKQDKQTNNDELSRILMAQMSPGSVFTIKNIDAAVSSSASTNKTHKKASSDVASTLAGASKECVVLQKYSQGQRDAEFKKSIYYKPFVSPAPSGNSHTVSNKNDVVSSSPNLRNSQERSNELHCSRKEVKESNTSISSELKKQPENQKLSPLNKELENFLKEKTPSRNSLKPVSKIKTSSESNTQDDSAFGIYQGMSNAEKIQEKQQSENNEICTATAIHSSQTNKDDLTVNESVNFSKILKERVSISPRSSVVEFDADSPDVVKTLPKKSNHSLQKEMVSPEKEGDANAIQSCLETTHNENEKWIFLVGEHSSDFSNSSDDECQSNNPDHKHKTKDKGYEWQSQGSSEINNAFIDQQHDNHKEKFSQNIDMFHKLSLQHSYSSSSDYKRYQSSTCDYAKQNKKGLLNYTIYEDSGMDRKQRPRSSRHLAKRVVQEATETGHPIKRFHTFPRAKLTSRVAVQQSQNSLPLPETVAGFATNNERLPDNHKQIKDGDSVSSEKGASYLKQNLSINNQPTSQSCDKVLNRSCSTMSCFRKIEPSEEAQNLGSRSKQTQEEHTSIYPSHEVDNSLMRENEGDSLQTESLEQELEKNDVKNIIKRFENCDLFDVMVKTQKKYTSPMLHDENDQNEGLQHCLSENNHSTASPTETSVSEKLDRILKESLPRSATALEIGSAKNPEPTEKDRRVSEPGTVNRDAGGNPQRRKNAPVRKPLFTSQISNELHTKDKKKSKSLRLQKSDSKYHGMLRGAPLYQMYNASLLFVDLVTEQSNASTENQAEEDESSPRNRLERFPSAMELASSSVQERLLWSELEPVRQSGYLEKMTNQEKLLQEAMFELIVSEASYLKSLEILCDVFQNSCDLQSVLTKIDSDVIFKDIGPVKKASLAFLSDLENGWKRNMLMYDLEEFCDIIYEHACNKFQVYVTYCSHKAFQDSCYNKLKLNNPKFGEVVEELCLHPSTHSLPMDSFLMLPMQRITRLPLLIDSVYKQLDTTSTYLSKVEQLLQQLNKIVHECNEGARKSTRLLEMAEITNQLEWGTISQLPLLTSTRYLVKRGDVNQLIFSNTESYLRTLKPKQKPLHMFLFTDLLLLTRKKSQGNRYVVVDYCERNMVEMEAAGENIIQVVNRPNLLMLILLSNINNKPEQMLLSCDTESEQKRWIEAFKPTSFFDEDQVSFDEWDCPQGQAQESYNPQQPDEIALNQTDVVKILKQTNDGLCYGERLSDGVRGWFPSSCVRKISSSSYVRARNLRQRYRHLQLSQTFLDKVLGKDVKRRLDRKNAMRDSKTMSTLHYVH